MPQFGLSCWGLRSSEFNGPAIMSDYYYVYKHCGFKIEWWRTWELTINKGVKKNGDLEQWKINELKQKKDFFFENDDKNYVFKNPALLLKKKHK